MQIEWYGQSAFRLSDGGTTVVIDPFADMTDGAHRLPRPLDGFTERASRVERLATPVFDPAELPGGAEPIVVVPATP